ncbi:MAG: ATP-binding cassette domain-containing protein, partial [Rhodothermales bacterium]|nr:ATP-binding cassette domain-containing protein [Rhodothermales bacterium]
MAFFAQHQAEEIPQDLTVLEALRERARGQSDTELRTLLGAFLFRGDDVFKHVRVLSGGEKSRLAQARTLLSPANFLILDEPTNHLDMASKAVLVEALRQYAGTFVVVSHDRHFLDAVVRKVWYVGGGDVRVYEGSYSEAVRKREALAEAAPTAPAPSGGDGQATSKPEPPSEPASSGPKTKEQKRREAEERNRLYRALQNGLDPGEITDPTLLRRYAERLENEIEQKESEKAPLEAQLADPDLYNQPKEFQRVMARFNAVEAELNDLLERWERAAERLQAVEA